MAERVACPILALLFCMAAGTRATEKLSELQAKFDRETNAVHKAKMVRKLGDAEFDEAGRAAQAGDYSRMGLLLEKYRDNVRAASEALQKANPDAVRHPNGYKQLEMHLQKALREIDDFLLEAPDPYKPPLQLVRRDLLNLDNRLLRCLFPAHAIDKPKSPKAASVAFAVSNPEVLR
ncbi:MAG: hypothetical protein WCE61_17320 [Candidatus Acidiferrum sp.]